MLHGVPDYIQPFVFQFCITCSDWPQSTTGKKNVLLKAKKLSDKDVLAFIAFENELRKARNAGCTTQDYYSVRSKYWSCQVQDGSCSWGGFYTLKVSLFGESLQTSH